MNQNSYTVKRYWNHGGPLSDIENPNGLFVLYEDYAKLERELAAMSELYAKEAHAKMVLLERHEPEHGAVKPVLHYTPIAPTMEQAQCADASGIADMGDCRLMWVLEQDLHRWDGALQPVEMLVPSSPATHGTGK